MIIVRYPEVEIIFLILKCINYVRRAPGVDYSSPPGPVPSLTYNSYSIWCPPPPYGQDLWGVGHLHIIHTLFFEILYKELLKKFTKYCRHSNTKRL